MTRFSNLRGVQWRIDLGILPHSSIDELRRVAADSRRKYARLRRCLLIDQPLYKDEGNKASDLVMDNPLSQNPDSTWGRFFRNAELEKMVDQDLSRLYPEHGSYFQASSCQAMLRRILLLWCLRHSEYGYRQGMHELLAPLLYVLHVDVQRLSQVREMYEDHFNDKFDDISIQESNSGCTYNFSMISSPAPTKWAMENDGKNSNQGTVAKVGSLDELDPNIQTIILLSDAYGAEGELGILLSERFMEHDAYCMFDALMSGASGAVAMADFFSPSPTIGSLSGIPPVIEASSALYHLLSIVDSSLHSHLVELGVEPQYFALRWLRVLFGREFSLEDLLIIWDKIFASSNDKSVLGAEDDVHFNNYLILCSPRGAFIAAMAVSMILYVRSSLFATEDATTCLKRLLNFPENIDVKKLIDKAKSLQGLALDTTTCPSPSLGTLNGSKLVNIRTQSLPSGSVSPRTPLSLVPDSYWEEKWRVLHKEEQLKQGRQSDPRSAGGKGLRLKERLNLIRMGSAPSSVKVAERKKDGHSSIRRRLLEDLSQVLGDDEDSDKLECYKLTDAKDSLACGTKTDSYDKLIEQNNSGESVTSMSEETCLSGPSVATEETSVCSSSSSPCSRTNDFNDLEKSSVISHSSTDENGNETISIEEPCSSTVLDDPQTPELKHMEATSEPLELKASILKQATVLKDRKPLSGKFPWFWKFGRSNEGAMEKGCNVEAQRVVSGGDQNTIKSSSTADECNYSLGIMSTTDKADKNAMSTLRNLGQSMLENIQVIESAFQQDHSQVGSLENLSRSLLGGKGQVTAMAALKELRKISNLLSEM